jgi:hypothetical protein
MALVKYGGGIIQASGSIAGTVHARNRFGNYIRARTKPVNPGTPGQHGVRDALSFLSTVWATILTSGQRIAWATYASSVAMKNRLGEVIYLTGFNHFIRSNCQTMNINQFYKADGPVTLSLPAKDTAFTAAGSAATQLLSIAFDPAQPWNHESQGQLQVFMGQPRKITQNFFAGPWKWANTLYGSISAPLTSPQTVAAPFTLTVGQLVTCYARIHEADGRLTEPMIYSFVVGA